MDGKKARLIRKTLEATGVYSDETKYEGMKPITVMRMQSVKVNPYDPNSKLMSRLVPISSFTPITLQENCGRKVYQLAKKGI